MQGIVDGEIGLQVPVGFLSRADKVHHSVAIGLQLLIFLGKQDVGGTLEYLIDLGIIVGVS